ncbi:MAG: sugar phosphate isomerase/epimerase [Opitutales bacterium]|jgi:L-ribulose-5-phosphate 3-epimerase|nr:sugar phosphate isomerase/epimerase [Opitutales bacterium]
MPLANESFYVTYITMKTPSVLAIPRRQFILQAGIAAGSLGLLPRLIAQEKASPLFEISLAQWTIQRELFSGKIDHLDFAKVAADHKIYAVEYVNQFFMDKAKDVKYLAEMKKRATDHGVRNLIIMCDREGGIGDPDEKKRAQTIENHRKWLDAAKFLGCHSIRVNARSSGSWERQVELAADGLSRLTVHGAAMGMNVIVENHGGLSSNADWLAEVMTRVNHPNCGTLPDTGNFRIANGESCDSYRGVKKLMQWAKGVSIKDKVWDDKGQQLPMDFERMLKLVTETGFRGHCGIEYGGYAGLNATRKRLEQVRDKLGA